MKKLHLGSGGLQLPGYINTDYDDFEGVDFALDASKVPYPFDDNSLDEVFSAHMVEHVNRDLVAPMIAEWRRILKPGGKVVAEIPDIMKAAKLLINAKNDGETESAMRIFYGLFEERETQGHRWGWTYETIRPLFIGFTTEEKPTQDYHQLRFDIPTFRIEATKL